MSENKTVVAENETTTESGMTRAQEIAAVIDAKYSIDDQIALLRQKDAKPEEWEAFNAFCEEVKSKIPARDAD
ncbi:MAG: hypothetical protein IJL89_02755 [Firmicutes bacterium]|nr:hypothetical protein [Bacillota bacterium]